VRRSNELCLCVSVHGHQILQIPTIHSSCLPPTIMSDVVPCDTLKYSQTLDAHNNTLYMHRSRNVTCTKRPKPIPTRWRPPSSLFPRLIFHFMCFCLTLHSDLDFMWKIFREPNGWEKFHTLYLTQINQLSTVVCRHVLQHYTFPYGS
jgi:hypothetical protein